MFTIKNAKPVFYALVFASTFAIGIAQAGVEDHGVLSKTADSEGSYCHLTFPAIRKETLGTNHPQLKSPAEGDIIDFYGPCDHDPLSKDEVERQMEDELVGGLRNYGGE